MKRVLVTIGSYLPGYKAGGPIRSVANLIEALGDEFEFRVVTSNRDLGEDKPYENIVEGSWQQVGKASVLYLSSAGMSLVNWCRALNSNSYDLLYLNSVFCRLTVKTLLLRAMGLVPREPVIVAPRGEFSEGALSIGTLKKLKKRAYMSATRLLSFYSGLIWQASSDREASDILTLLGNDVSPQQVLVAPDISHIDWLSDERACDSMLQQRTCSKAPGFAKVVFLSRIARMKNLAMAIELLGQVKGKVEFDIYGPLEDEDYWNQCCARMRHLPANVQVCYKGVVAAEQVHEVFSQYHLFIFPTLGENYGHVIPEALSAGCLVLTSDRTPWHDFDRDRIGWTLPLDDTAGFVDAIDEVIDMTSKVFDCCSRNAIAFANEVATDKAVLEANCALFRQALSQYGRR